MKKTINKSRLQKVKTRHNFLELINEVKEENLGRRVQDLMQRKNITEEEAIRHFRLFEITDKQLAHYANPTYSNRFKHFTIPKKSGGKRHIYAPVRSLKQMQGYIYTLLQEMYKPLPCVFGFTSGRTVVDNASEHLGQRFVFNVDLRDFFTSVSQARIWGRLQAKPYCLSQPVANLIAGICCIGDRTTIEKRPIKTIKLGLDISNETNQNLFSTVDFEIDGHRTFVKGYLPQGAPTSPILTNMVCERLDKRLMRLAEEFHLRYSRYADDITFSSMHNVYEDESNFRKSLREIIESEGFKINPAKTRLQSRAMRQEVTGLTIGKKVNVSRKYVKNIRMLLHMCETYGIESAQNHYLEYTKWSRPSKHYESNYGSILENVIQGKLEFLKMVKGNNDCTYLTLKARFDKIFGVSMKSEQYSIYRKQLEKLPAEFLGILNKLS